MNQSKSMIVAALLLPLSLVVGLLLFVAMDEEDRAADCGIASGAGGTGAGVAAVAVDLATVPQGPVAGYAGEQLVNAAQVMIAAKQLGLSLRDQQIGVMTAMGESGLRVLDYGDSAGPDSRGLFQQRDNGAWGTLTDRMDPVISATNFFKVERTIAGRETLEPTIVANRVQANADPYYYEPFWGPAGQVVDALAGIRPASSVAPVAQTGAAGTAAGAGSGAYQLGPVTPQLTALVAVLGPMFAITTVGGYRESARDPGGHPAGLAADFMVPLTSAGQAQGDALAAYAQAHAAELKIDYILWRQRIWSVARAAEGWRPMDDRGSPTENHFDHVHINVTPTPNAGGQAAPGSENAQAIGAGSGAAVGGGDCAIALASSGTWVQPIQDAPVNSPYGPRINPVSGQPSFHDGVDYDADCGTPFRAAAAGVVVKAGPDPIYGHQIIVEHGEYPATDDMAAALGVAPGTPVPISTRYGHMYADRLDVRVGDQVTTGQVLGEVGSDGWSTGCHLHFTVAITVGGTANGVEQTVEPTAFLANPPGGLTGGKVAGDLVMAHANIKVSLPRAAFVADLSAATGNGAGDRPDFVTLNEVASRSDEDLRVTGYDAFRAPATAPASQTRSTAVIWRPDRWSLVDGGRVLLVPSGPQRWDAGRSATWVTLRGTSPETAGTVVSVISTHMMINPALYGPNPELRRQLYAEGMRRLQELVATLSPTGPVFIAGDFNSQYTANDLWGPRAMLGAIGMRSTMDDQGPVRTTDGGGVIDYVFFQPAAVGVTRQQTSTLNSDHLAITASFSPASGPASGAGGGVGAQTAQRLTQAQQAQQDTQQGAQQGVQQGKALAGTPGTRRGGSEQ